MPHAIPTNKSNVTTPGSSKRELLAATTVIPSNASSSSINETKWSDSNTKINEPDTSFGALTGNETTPVSKGIPSQINSSVSTANSEINKNPEKNFQEQLSRNSVTANTEAKSIVHSENQTTNNRPDYLSDNSDSSQVENQKDETLFNKYLNYQDNRISQQNSQDIVQENNRPVAVNDKAVTHVDVPVNINILRNDKDADDDKFSVMGLSPPRLGNVVSNQDGTITYSPLKSWSGTEIFAYSIIDSNGGIASASVAVVVQPGEN